MFCCLINSGLFPTLLIDYHTYLSLVLAGRLMSRLLSIGMLACGDCIAFISIWVWLRVMASTRLNDILFSPANNHCNNIYVRKLMRDLHIYRLTLQVWVCNEPFSSKLCEFVVPIFYDKQNDIILINSTIYSHIYNYCLLG